MLFFVIFEVILRITFKYTFKLEPVDFSIPISRTDENTTSGLSFPPSSLPTHRLSSENMCSKELTLPRNFYHSWKTKNDYMTVLFICFSNFIPQKRLLLVRKDSWIFCKNSAEEGVRKSHIFVNVKITSGSLFVKKINK